VAYHVVFYLYFLFLVMFKVFFIEVNVLGFPPLMDTVVAAVPSAVRSRSRPDAWLFAPVSELALRASLISVVGRRRWGLARRPAALSLTSAVLFGLGRSAPRHVSLRLRRLSPVPTISASRRACVTRELYRLHPKQPWRFFRSLQSPPGCLVPPGLSIGASPSSTS
jgi:hypothetical protein